jgi:hypothetical protein
MTTRTSVKQTTFASNKRQDKRQQQQGHRQQGHNSKRAQQVAFPLQALPAEILLMVSEYTDVRSLQSLACADKSMRAFVSDIKPHLHKLWFNGQSTQLNTFEGRTQWLNAGKPLVLLDSDEQLRVIVRDVTKNDDYTMHLSRDTLLIKLRDIKRKFYAMCPELRKDAAIIEKDTLAGTAITLKARTALSAKTTHIYRFTVPIAGCKFDLPVKKDKSGLFYVIDFDQISTLVDNSVPKYFL